MAHNHLKDVGQMQRGEVDSQDLRPDGGEMGHCMVIFGCGYLGRQLARESLARGFRVTALTRNAQTAGELRKLGVHSVVEAELGEDSWHGEIDPSQDYVVNCVGSFGGGLTGYVKSYLDGQRSILRWAENGPIGTFVFTSSVSVYPQTDRSLVSETSSCEGVSDRGALLLAAESIGFSGSDSIGRSFVLRLGGIYGPGRHLFLDRLRNGDREFPGEGEAFLNLIHRDDACSAVWAALEAPPEIIGRIHNVSDCHPAPRQEVVEWLAEKMGVKPPVFIGSPKLSSDTASSRETPNRRIDNGRIREELGWEPSYPSFREGYEALLAENRLS